MGGAASRIRTAASSARSTTSRARPVRPWQTRPTVVPTAATTMAMSPMSGAARARLPARTAEATSPFIRWAPDAAASSNPDSSGSVPLVTRSSSSRVRAASGRCRVQISPMARVTQAGDRVGLGQILAVKIGQRRLRF